MVILAEYRGYRIYRERGHKKRIHVSGYDISPLQYWYNINNCKAFIDFWIKWVLV